MRRWRLSPFVAPLVALALGGCLGAAMPMRRGSASAPDRPAAGSARPSAGITRAELNEHLAALQRIADRNRGTRAAGTPGYDQSADYVAARLKDAGWRVTRPGVPFTYFRLHDASLTIGGRELTRAATSRC